MVCPGKGWNIATTRAILNRERELERFEFFIFDVEDALEEFIAEAARAGFNLDYTLDSLDRLEEYYKSQNLAEPERERFIQNAARYFGQTVRRVYGGKWYLEIEDPKNLYYGLLCVTGHAPSEVRLCPHHTFRMFTRNLRPGFLRQVVERHVHPRDLDLRPEKI